MALPQVGIRFVTENLSGYTSALAQAERANESFKASVRSIPSQSGINDLGQRVQRQSGTIRTGFAQAGQAATGFGRTVVSAAGVATAALAGIGTVALTGFAKSAVDARVEFDKQMSGVQAVLQATAEETKSLEEEALRLGSSTQFTARQSAQGIELLARNGLQAEQILGGALEGSLNLAAATGIEDLGLSADILTDALSNFGEIGNDYTRAINGITGVTVASKIGIEDYNLALGQAGGVAGSVGVSFEDFNTTLAATVSRFASGAAAGTGLRAFLTRLVPNTDAASDKMRALGIITEEGSNRFFDAAGNLKSMNEISVILNESLGQLNDQAKSEAINRIFGVDASRTVVGLIDAGAYDPSTGETIFSAFAEGISEVDAAAQANTRLDNLAGDITKAQSAFEGLQLAAVKGATPALRSFFQTATVGLSATTTFIDALNEGKGVFQSTAEGLSALNLEAFQIEQIGDDFLGIDIGGVIQAEIDNAAGFVDVNIADFIRFSSDDLDGGVTRRQLNIGDFFDLTLDNIGDDSFSVDIAGFLQAEIDNAAGFIDVNIADFITFSSDEIGSSLQGTLETVTKLNIGDFIDFSNTSFSEALTGATSGITKLKVGDFIDLTATSGELGSTININDVIVGAYDLLSNITKVKIGDVFTGALNLTTGEGSVKIGDDLEFEFDLSNINTQIQTQLSNLQATILGSAVITEGGIELAPATEGLASRIQSGITGAINAALAGEFALELPQDFSFALPEGFAAEDLLSVTGGLDSLGESLSSLDSFLTTETGDAGALASFVTSINESIGGLAQTVGEVDGQAIGESLTGVVTSITSIFTTLNTIDDLALGGIAGTVGDLASSLLGLATDITTGLDADAIGEAAAQGAADFVGSFAAVFEEPDFPEIAGAAAGLVAAIGSQFREALSPGNLTAVGESLGELATGILTQISNTLSNPEFGSQIGQGLSDIVVGITQGLSDVLSGFNDIADESDSDIGGAVESFVTNLVTALGEGLASADYAVVVSGLLEGIGRSLGQFAPEGAAETAQAQSGVIDLTQPREQRTLGGEVRFLTDLVGITSPEPESPDLSFIEDQREAQRGLSESAATLTDTATTLAETGTTASEAAEAAQQSWTNFLSFGLLDVENAGVEEARRTGLGTGAAFDETDIAGSVEDQILTQLNFGDLPDQISTAATDAIATAIPSEPIIDSEAVNTALLTAAQEAIPPETVIDTETVNNTLLTAAQEAIPPTSVPEFPGWESIIEVRVPRIPRFPTWRQVANFRIPSIPSFPGWSTFISFDIPSIPSFPGWASFVGGIDIAATIPPFPGWAALLGGSRPSAPSTASSSPSPNIPEFQTGSESVPQTGVALVGEQGPELRLINQGDRIFPAGVTSRILDTARAIASRMPSINGDPNDLIGGTTNVVAQTNVNNVGVTIDGGSTGSPSGFDVAGLAVGIVDAFAMAFSVPGFPGWDSLFDVSPVRIPRFPGWTNIVGLDDISVQILRTENITQVIDDEEEGREFTGGLQAGIDLGASSVVDASSGTVDASSIAAESETSTPTTTIPSLPPVVIPRQPSRPTPPPVTESPLLRPSAGAGASAGRGAAGVGGLFRASAVTESSMVVNQPVNNTNINVVRNFNLTTNSLRSSENISNDFVLMERLAAVGGIA